MQTTPMATDVTETTITANFAALKLPAPSSFDTLTLLEQQRQVHTINSLYFCLLRSEKARGKSKEIGILQLYGVWIVIVGFQFVYIPSWLTRNLYISCKQQVKSRACREDYLIAALNPRAIIASHPCMFMLQMYGDFMKMKYYVIHPKQM